MSFPKIYPVINETVTNLKSYNFYIINNEKTVFLIDTGINTDESWQLLLNRLEDHQLDLQDIDFILLTHSHVDHIGLINRIRQQIDIPVYAHSKALPHLKRDDDYLQMRINFFHKLYAEMGCGSHGEKRVHEMKQAIENNKDQKIKGEITLINDGDMISGFQVISAPGHADDHVVFYEPLTGVLFSGDNLFAHINSNALIGPDEDGHLLPSLQQYEKTLLKLNQLFITTIYPGHGDMIKAPDKRIEAALRHIFNKAERIIKKLDNKQLTAAEIAEQMYGKLYETLFSFVMSEVIGHLHRLQTLGEVTYEIHNGTRYYRVIE